MSLFNVSEIYQFAIKIEENGEKFYREFSEKFDDKEIKALFNLLADEEIKHKNTFEKMLSKIENYQPRESYPGEYFSYLKAYAENIIFNVDELKSKVSKISSVIDALNFAIEREWDSILYYQEIKIYVDEDRRNLIDRIIMEERNHFVRLNEAKRLFK